jgi:hypothetical protein
MLVYEVRIKNSAEKSALKMPSTELKRFRQLIYDLEAIGPVQPGWSNYSKLGKDKYHCHLSYKWVACWTNKNGSIEIEVYYAGSRENAPY